jgi:hypothetical protein
MILIMNIMPMKRFWPRLVISLSSRYVERWRVGVLSERLIYNQREFSLFTTFCVSFAVLGLLPSFASTLYYGMGYAGTGGKMKLLQRIVNEANRLHRYDMGLDRSHGWRTMRRYEHG